MKPSLKKDYGQQDLFRSRLDQIINLNHPLAELSKLLDWQRLAQVLRPYYAEIGRPGIPLRLIMGLHLLKYIYALSDESVCARWEENPYFQYFCGEPFFHHGLPIERSSMSHFRDRITPEALEKLLQESLSAAYQAGALNVKDLRKLAIDTTVQEKAIAHPTDHGLMLKAMTKLAEVAKACGIKVWQSYKRVAKGASIAVGRYLHARQMNRAKKRIKFIRTRLKRLVRDIERKAQAKFEDIPQKLKDTLNKAKHIAKQKRGDPDYLYAWHAPEVECISKGKARKPYEFGCKVSLATQLRTSKGGKHFILGAQALHGRPYDGHTLKKALDQLEEVVGCPPDESYVDKGYKGHKCQERTRVYMSGQKRGVTQKIKQEIKRRSVIEPIIGHAKNDGYLGYHWLKGKKGDQLNALFSVIGFNLRQLLSYLDDQRHLLPA